MSRTELSSIPLFAGLSMEEIKQLESGARISSYPAGELLFIEGQADDDCFVLLDGQVEVIKALGSPEERLLGVRSGGSLLGEMSIFCQDGCHTATVRSLTDLRLLQISHVQFDKMLQIHPGLGYGLIRILSRRLDEAENVSISTLKEKNQRLQEAYQELKDNQEQLVEKDRLEQELEFSGQIQQSILPQTLPAIPGYDISALMYPARAVGGDFFTCLKLSRDRLGIVVGDVTDKGTPAALFMALAYGAISIEATRSRSPADVLRKVNRHLLKMNAYGMFVTLVYGILDSVSGIFHYARAAHPPPYLLDEVGRVIDVPISPGQPLGLFKNLPIDEQTIQLPPGATLLLYTDGVSETQDIDGIQFAPDGLYQSLAANRMRPAIEICDQLWQDVQLHGQGLPQQDDFTTVVIKRLSTARHEIPA
jgi:sigma-B regulation protein RsbU (phosphoserine phosphatase)